jgi:peptide/nickel transport system substrate-binding protein
MIVLRKLLLFLLVLSLFATASNCRRRNSDAVTVAIPENFSTFDTLTTVKSDAAAERIKNLMFNSLVRKDANFDYVGELASNINTSEDGKTITFTLREGVKFHNGKAFTSADVKYTLDELFKSNGYKSGAFFDTVPINKQEETHTPPPANTAASTSNLASNTGEPEKTKRVPHIISIEAPDPKTIVINIARSSLRYPLLSNLVAIPIIPDGTVSQQKDSPVGSGPFKFVSLDSSQNIIDLTANADYWEGPPKVMKLRLKTVTDASSLQAELQSGGVDLAPNPSNMPPDMIKAIGGNGNIKVDQFDGSNIQYLVFNTQSPPLNNAKVRQAIGYAIDRQKIVTQLLADQAKISSSVLPANSWAYTPGKAYEFDPAKANQLLREAGYKNEEIVFKYGSGNAAVNQYSQAIQNSLKEVGLNIRIETLEVNVIRQQLAQGQYQMYTGVWIGGNQDPIFMRDLFSSTKIPGGSVSCCNRSRYINEQVDKIVEDAINTTDKAAAKELYVRAWNMISEDLPLLPLWCPANIVVSNKRVGNIKMSGSGDWGFLKDITVQ